MSARTPIEDRNAAPLTCKHCGRGLVAPAGRIHESGPQRGLARCSPHDTCLPYGYNGEPEGEPCGPICLGSSS